MEAQDSKFTTEQNLTDFVRDMRWRPRRTRWFVAFEGRTRHTLSRLWANTLAPATRCLVFVVRKAVSAPERGQGRYS
jgi:hypothetical protein